MRQSLLRISVTPPRGVWRLASFAGLLSLLCGGALAQTPDPTPTPRADLKADKEKKADSGKNAAGAVPGAAAAPTGTPATEAQRQRSETLGKVVFTPSLGNVLRASAEFAHNDVEVDAYSLRATTVAGPTRTVVPDINSKQQGG